MKRHFCLSILIENTRSQKMACLLGLMVTALASHAQDAPNASNPSSDKKNLEISLDFLDLAKLALSKLDQTKYQGNDFDYWPHGGLRSTYDHLKTFGDYKSLLNLSPVPVYLDGIHRNGNLKLNSSDDFGRYNPEFLDWAMLQIQELKKDEGFIQANKALVRKYLLNLVKLYRETWEVFKEDKVSFEVLLSEYKSKIEEHSLEKGFYYEIAFDGAEKYPFFAELVAEDKNDVNLVAPAVYFWLRRHMDGTSEKMHALFKLVDETFSP